MECLQNILIGLVSGAISSFIVTYFWNKRILKVDAINKDREAAQEYARQFKEDIQTLCHYLDHLRLELDLPEAKDKAANIRRLVDSRPGTSSFVGGMKEEGIALMRKLNCYLHELDDEAAHDKLTTVKCNTYKGKLFVLECDLLKNQNVIRKPWSESKLNL